MPYVFNEEEKKQQTIFYFFAVFMAIGKSRNILLHTNRIIFSFEMFILLVFSIF